LDALGFTLDDGNFQIYSPPEIMKLILALLIIGFTASVRADDPTVETIVVIRHGEKPKGGLGQLTCRGLNRALALPKVLLGKYGTPQFIFAPNTTQKVDGKIDTVGAYYYVRPLMTIEPTAIRCGLPVNTQFGFMEIGGLESELKKPQYKNATIFIAWEHALLDIFVKDMVKKYGGDPGKVPTWPGKDYDTIFLLKITRSEGKESIAFTIDHENLNDLSDDCPDK
jgi:hypothetical protein